MQLRHLTNGRMDFDISAIWHQTDCQSLIRTVCLQFGMIYDIICKLNDDNDVVDAMHTVYYASI